MSKRQRMRRSPEISRKPETNKNWCADSGIVPGFFGNGGLHGDNGVF